MRHIAFFRGIYGSKLELHPVCHLGQTSVLCITHGVFLFLSCKDPLNGFFPALVELRISGRISDI